MDPPPETADDGVVAGRFEAYDTSHLLALLILVVGVVVLIVVGRLLRDADPQDRFGKVFAVAMVVGTVPLQVLYFTPAYFDFDKTLPVQLCDFASFVGAYALWTHRRWAVALTYLWGIPLTTQAVLTPDLTTPFPDPVFVLFWVMHIAIIWAAAYLSFGRGLGPNWRDYGVAVALTAAWALAAYCFNVAFDTNYGFLVDKPGNGSILDLLGPWPVYIAAEIAVICVVWALMTWPYARRRAPETC